MPHDMLVCIPDLQISFYHRLREIEKLYLGAALSETIRYLNINTLDLELSKFVNPGSLTKVASFGLRGELFFPVPYLITANPYLLGYYRLLYGLSRKEFYSKSGFGKFEVLESRGKITPILSDLVINLCLSLITTGQILVNSIDYISPHIIHGLQLITFGAQLRGGGLNKIGQEAVKEMYELIRNVVAPYITNASKRAITIKNDSGRIILIEFMSDPDIRVQELLQTGIRPVVAIEIKGGRDVSNVYNRLGEAEKSHNKARNVGFNQFWTIIRANLDLAKAKVRSPSTHRFFYLDRITDQSTSDYCDFKELFCSLIGIRS